MSEESRKIAEKLVEDIEILRREEQIKLLERMLDESWQQGFSDCEMRYRLYKTGAMRGFQS